MELKIDCRHFPGDRPCTFHKETGVKCSTCAHYGRIGTKILIIKLEAVGDVLRTTCILRGMRAQYGDAEITWITKKASLDLFPNNPYVNRVLDCDACETLVRLNVERFDLVVNLDVSFQGAALASYAHGREELGFGLSERGFIVPLNEEAEPWLEMGAFDDVKRRNSKTYQHIMLEICRLDPPDHDVILRLSEEEKAFARVFAQTHRLSGKPTIGLNTGSGARWPAKRWTLEGFVALVKRIHERREANVLLFGGPHEEERNRRIRERVGDQVVDTGTGNTLRRFFSLVDLCDVLVTGDTLALHVGVALGKKVVALFGPTSAAEIDLYGRGIKLTSELNCLCCYRRTCDKSPNCMEALPLERVFRAVERLMEG